MFLSETLQLEAFPMRNNSNPCQGTSCLLQFASRLCRAGPNHLKDSHSISTAAPFQALPIRLSSWLFLANPPRFLSKLLLCSSRPFHVGSDQTVLFPIWSGPVCAMPSLSEQIQFKERQFRFRSLLTSPKHRSSRHSLLLVSFTNHCCSGLAVPTLCFSFPLQGGSSPIVSNPNLFRSVSIAAGITYPGAQSGNTG